MKHLFALFTAVMTTCLLHAQDEAKLVINLKGVEKTDTLTLQWGAINKSMNPHIANTLARHPDTLRVPL
ncbi:MAG: hypothetical protein HUK02_10375, partial [Bacteroidaceae bacterium]|nr:hypothetical protein [Bacteroidaceae bacterium]